MDGIRWARPGQLLLAGLALATLACGSPRRWDAAVPPVQRREPVVDILDYEIELDLDHEAGYVDGRVAIKLAALAGEPVTELTLDAAELNVFGAWDGQGRELPLRVDGETLVVSLAAPLRDGEVEIVVLDYEAFPRLGIHFVGPSGANPERPWHIWTQGQSEDTRHWMPVWDYPNEMATHTLALTVDADLATVGAGRLVDSTTNERSGRRTDVWRMDTPHVSYLTTFVAGGLAHGSLGTQPVPLDVLAEPGSLERALENSSATGAMLDFFAELTGLPYPYEKYAQVYVDNYTAGGMENISASTLYSEGLHDPADRPQMELVGLLAHEAAHQWFGDLITCDGWGEVWLNEGFADWCEARYLGATRGEAHMLATLLSWRRAYMNSELADSRPIVWHDFDHPDDVFADHAYSGGAVRLRLLRETLGGPAFDAALQDYVERFAGRLVTTGDLQRSLEQSTGADLSTFFEEWLLGPGFPRFEARVTDGDPPVLGVEQVQARDGWRNTFHVDLPVSWSRGGVEQRGVVAFQSSSARLPLGGSGPLDWVRLDADTSVPCQIQLAQPAAAWARQLAGASAPMTRLIAAQWLARDRWLRPEGDVSGPADPASWPALLAATRGDSFIDVRLVALAALADTEAPELESLCLELIADPDARLREGAYAILGARFPMAALDPLLEAVDDPNAGVAFSAIAALIRGRHPDGIDALIDTVATTDKVRLARDLVSLAPVADDDRVLPLLMRTARRHPQRWVRVAAVQALSTLDGPLGEPVFRQLCTSLWDDSYSVRAAAARSLGQRDDPRARNHLLARRDIEGHRSVLGAIDAALKALD